MRLDHVIVTTPDLDGAAAQLLVDHGLGSVAGGRHEAWGTANRLVPAGSSYVELMGIVDEDVARDNPLGRFVLASAAAGPHLAAVCLRCEDDAELAALSERLGLPATPGGRTRPDGTALTWSLVGMEQALAERLPFFIRWDGESGAQGIGALDAGAAATAISVRLGGDPDRVRAWVGADVPGLEYDGGDPGLRAVVLDLPTGPVTLR